MRLLEQYDVDTVFGIPGVHTLEIYRGLAASEIRHVSPRHEQGAAFMADGYARVAGKPGVCLLITGAGLTNAATPIAGAYHDSIPMLVVSSATASNDNGRGHGSLHDLPDQRAFMATITAESIDVRDPAELPEAFARAFEIFESRRPRPVHIGIPIDVLGLPAASWERLPARGAAPVADAALVERAVELLAGAERPMLLLGGGAAGRGRGGGRRRRAPRGARRHDGQRQGPAARQPSAQPRHVADAAARHAAFAEADVVVAVGTEFSETDYFYAPGEAAPEFSGALIRIDIDADQLHSQRPAAVGLHGDARATLAAIDAGLAARGRERDARRRARGRPARGPAVARRRGAHAVPEGARRGPARRRDPRRRLHAAGLRRPPLVARARARHLHRARRLRHARPGPADGDRRADRRARTAPSRRSPATAARCSRSRSSRAPPTSACRSRS